MNRTDFEKLDAELLAAADAVLKQRRGAYADNIDVLRNFKEVGTLTQTSPKKVCQIFMYKAFSAFGKLLNDEEIPGETVEERASDLINYVRLGYGLLKEVDIPKRAANRIVD